MIKKVCDVADIVLLFKFNLLLINSKYTGYLKIHSPIYFCFAVK